MTNTTQQEPAAPFPAKLLILIALVQGLLLFWLRQAHLHDFWPATHPVTAHLLLSLVLVIPTFVLLALTDQNRKRLLAAGAGAGLLTALIAGYIAFQLQPNETVPDNSILLVYYLTLTLFLFKATMYSQVWSAGADMSYRALFQYSWRNTMLMALCLLFTLLFWGILLLWGLLFEAIGINFFEQLFEEEWFLYPALSLAYGLAFSIFRKLVNILDTMARVLQALCQFLLPILVVVALLFLTTLPFVGLSALWGTGNGTELVLWLQVLILFLVNAVYQDEQRDTPYWVPLHRLIYIGVALLPLYSLIAGYGLYLRVEQYGLTVERCWALLVCAIMAAFVFSYCWAIIRRRDGWVTSFRTTNVRIGLLFMALMVLVNTPLLDFRKASLNSQLAQLHTGKQSLESLDLSYIAHHLGRPGYLALEKLKAENGEDFSDRVAEAYRYRWRNVSQRTRRQVSERITVYPTGSTAPQALIAKITSSDKNESITQIALIEQDLNRDGIPEWVQFNNSGWIEGKLWFLTNNQWQFKPIDTGYWRTTSDRMALFKNIKQGNISAVPAKWQRIKIGDKVFQVNERESE